jgi:hypothetical protein
MLRATLVALLVAGFAGAASAQVAQDDGSQSKANERLVIVNGNTHRVIYDDGRDDMFCVARKHVVGYTASGRPIFRSTMRCR